jgi:hypothetical protein
MGRGWIRRAKRTVHGSFNPDRLHSRSNNLLESSHLLAKDTCVKFAVEKREKRI